MPGSYQTQTRDLTKQYLGFDRGLDTFRPVPSAAYLPGITVALVPLDQQQFPDQSTVQPSLASANPQIIMGIVADTWVGFNGSIGLPSYTAGANQTTARGTQGVDCVTGGYHPAAYIDQSGSGAVAITNGIPLVPSRATVGYLQGATYTSAPGGLGTAAAALLPSTLTLTAAALVQASQTFTIGGTPTVGDTYTINLGAPYNTTAPGVAQILSYLTPALTTAQAVSVTTAAAAVAAYLNSQASFTNFFSATSAAGVVTVTVNGLGAPFQFTFAVNGALTSQYNLGLSGVVGNLVTSTATANGVSTITAGGATLTGGTGFKGTIPVLVVSSS